MVTRYWLGGVRILASATIYWEAKHSLGKPNAANGIRVLLGARKHQYNNLKLATVGFKGVTEYPCISRGKVLVHSGGVQSYEPCGLGKLVT